MKSQLEIEKQIVACKKYLKKNIEFMSEINILEFMGYMDGLEWCLGNKYSK